MPEYDELAEATAPNPELLKSEDAGAENEANIHQLFDRSVSNVHVYSSKMQQAYINPAYGHVKAFSEVYPVLSLYIGISSVLSLIPIVIFLCSSIFVLSASILLALTLAIMFAVSVISFFGLLLSCTLFWASLVSIAATVLVLGAYQVTRLVALVREQPTWQDGIRKWVFELREIILSRLPDGHRGRGRCLEEPEVKAEVIGADL